MGHSNFWRKNSNIFVETLISMPNELFQSYKMKGESNFINELNAWQPTMDTLADNHSSLFIITRAPNASCLFS